VSEARNWIDFDNPDLSIREQCRLLGLHRSNVYYQPAPETAENLLLMRLMDEEHLLRPARGSRQMVDFLKDEGHTVNRKRIQRLMRKMGIESLAPKPRTTIPIEGHRVYPYLLRNLEIVRPDQVWCCDITYIPTAGVLLPRGRDGLVQSIRDLLAIVEQHGCRFLCRGFGGSLVERDA
jgi:putative transposase